MASKKAPKAADKAPDDSSAYLFVLHIWEGAQLLDAGHSWQRFNGALHATLCLAITAGLHFDDGDFRRFWSEMRGSRWFNGNDGAKGEHFYTEAVKCGNDSACRSFEAWVGRKPFVFGGSRLHVGAPIEWGGVYASVTSFAKDGSSLTACSYKDTDGHRREVDKRLTIALEDLRAAEKGRREHVRAGNERAAIIRAMQLTNDDIDRDAVNAWSKDQRAEALAWVKLGWDRSEHTPPAVLLAASKRLAARRQTAAEVA